MVARKSICSVEGCGKEVIAKGLCNPHYRRLKKGGDPYTDDTPVQIYGAMCAVCGEKAYGKRLCKKHYDKSRRGTLFVTRTEPGSVLKWLDDHKEYDGDDCLMWPFSRSRVTGFGTLTVKGRSHRAHRLMCELAHGSAPEDNLHAAHSCGKGHLGCVNPKHLRWATPIENAADKVEHGTAPRGTTNGHSRLNEADVLSIRRQAGDGVAQRLIAEKFGITRAAVSAIVVRRNWAWLD